MKLHRWADAKRRRQARRKSQAAWRGVVFASVICGLLGIIMSGFAGNLTFMGSGIVFMLFGLAAAAALEE